MDSRVSPTEQKPSVKSQELKDKEAMNKMIKVSIVCLIFMFAEALGGYIAGSLAIMTDAAHLFSDLSSFMISIFSIWIGQKQANKRYTFGYQRAEVLGALTSVVLIWILTLFLMKEAIDRFYHPTEIVAKYMLITAIFGLACNLVMIKVLHSGVFHFFNFRTLEATVTMAARIPMADYLVTAMSRFLTLVTSIPWGKVSLTRKKEMGKTTIIVTTITILTGKVVVILIRTWF